jgi:hypothetical protein
MCVTCLTGIKYETRANGCILGIKCVPQKTNCVRGKVGLREKEGEKVHPNYPKSESKNKTNYENLLT